MIRHFYFLYLLVCIESVFCYDYISEGSELRSKKFVGKRKQWKNNRRFKRHQYEPLEEGPKEKSNVAEIDLASFMARPEYDSFEDNESYETGVRNRKISLKDYGDYGTLAKSDDNNQRKDKSYFDDNLLELNNVDQGPGVSAAVEKKKPARPKKKTLSQKIKIPFFSHKNETQKMKKNKKRKLVRSTSKKKVAVSSDSSAQGQPKSSFDNAYDLQKKKRSYKEHICSICRRKFRVSVKDRPGNKKAANDMVHNSRQYFQDAAKNGDKQRPSLVTTKVEKVDTKAPDESLEVERMRRDDAQEREVKQVQEIDEKERQLKELEEVRRKIDNDEIKMMMPERKMG